MKQGQKTKPNYGYSRREFLTFVTVSGVSVGLSGLSALLPTPVLAQAQWHAEQLDITLPEDPVFGNYPVYAEAITFGRGHLTQHPSVEVDLDPQLLM